MQLPTLQIFNFFKVLHVHSDWLLDDVMAERGYSFRFVRLSKAPPLATSHNIAPRQVRLAVYSIRQAKGSSRSFADCLERQCSTHFENAYPVLSRGKPIIGSPSSTGVGIWKPDFPERPIPPCSDLAPSVLSCNFLSLSSFYSNILFTIFIIALYTSFYSRS